MARQRKSTQTEDSSGDAVTSPVVPSPPLLEPDQTAENPERLIDSWEAAIRETTAGNPNAEVVGKTRKTGPRATRVEVGTLRLPSERVANLARPFFRIITQAAKVDPVTEDELREWSKDAAPALDHYLAKYLEGREDLVALIIATAILAAPRITQAMDNAKRDKARKATTEVSPTFE